MDEKQYLILVKDQDKTAEVESFEVLEALVKIKFTHAPKFYSYQKNNVLICDSPTVTDIRKESAVYCDDVPLYKVLRVINFGDRVRIQYENGGSKICDAAAIRLESTVTGNGSAASTLAYWRDIAQYVSVSDEGNHNATFLGRQFDELRFVSPASVLGSFMNGNEIGDNASSNADALFPFNYNLSQREALSNAFKHQVSIIEGPPGTGKTQTILNILANCVERNKTVAVVSSNNSAVENVRDKLSAAGYDFLIASLGKSENRNRFFGTLTDYEVGSDWLCEDESGVRKELVQLSQRIENLMSVQRQAVQLKQELAAYELERDHFEIYYKQQTVDMPRNFRFDRLSPEKILSLIADLRWYMEGRSGDGLLFRLRVLFRYRLLNWSQLKRQGTDVILVLQEHYYDAKIQYINSRISALKKQLSTASFDSLLKRHRDLSDRLLRHSLYKKYRNTSNKSFTVTNYKSKFGEFTKRYPIVLSTTHSLRNSIPQNYLFDYLIVDESSQVDLLSGALALSCCKNAIIVGDTKQLPQIVDQTISKRIGRQRDFAQGPYDYFSHNLLSSMLAQYGDAIPRVVLREHYRCHPKIIGFCNQKYYDGQLIPFTSEDSNDNPLMIYATVQGNHMRHVVHGRAGKFNQRELDVIEQEILANLTSDTPDYSDIGVVTPYRKQVEKATNQFGRGIEVDTIHKYQGREKPTMIFSTVLDSSGSGKQGIRFVNDPNKINVAVSRAQKKFILVTDHKLFRESNSEIGDLIRYIEYNTLDSNIVESKVVSVFDLLYKECSPKLRSFKNHIRGGSSYESERIATTLIADILREPRYTSVRYREQVFLRNLFHNTALLDESERSYIRNGASVDILFYTSMNKSPILAVEVDGFAFHENSPRQLQRDCMKDHIFAMYGLTLLRLPTMGSGEEEKIRGALDAALSQSENWED